MTNFWNSSTFNPTSFINRAGKHIEGSKFSDNIRGTFFNDTINGHRGNDILCGGPGNDSLNGGKGNDVIYGGFGNDTISGGNGQDFLYGGAGKDVLNGGLGNDYLYGGAGDDILSGWLGDDTFGDGQGNNIFNGGGGNDTFHIDSRGQNGTTQKINAGTGDDEINIDARNAFNNTYYINTSNGADKTTIKIDGNYTFERNDNGGGTVTDSNNNRFIVDNYENGIDNFLIQKSKQETNNSKLNPSTNTEKRATGLLSDEADLTPILNELKKADADQNGIVTSNEFTDYEKTWSNEALGGNRYALQARGFLSRNFDKMHEATGFIYGGPSGVNISKLDKIAANDWNSNKLSIDDLIVQINNNNRGSSAI